MLEHYRLAEQTYGYNRTCGHMRKFGILGADASPAQGRPRGVRWREDARSGHGVVEQWYNG